MFSNILYCTVILITAVAAIGLGFCYAALPMQLGLIISVAGYIGYIVLTVLLTAKATAKADRRATPTAVLYILSEAIKWAAYIAVGIFSVVYSVEYIIERPQLKAATVSTVATVEEHIATENTHYLIVTYLDDTGTEQRATIDVVGNALYLKGDKIAVRYNPSNKEDVYTAKVTVESPLIHLRSGDSNPLIIKE